HAALPGGACRRPHPGPGRSRQNHARQLPGPHRLPPPALGPLLSCGPAPEASQGRAAGRHLRTGAAAPAPGRSADPRRLRPGGPGRHRAARLLPGRGGEAPPRVHHPHLQPRAPGVAGPDGRPHARPVRGGPHRQLRLRAGPGGRVLPVASEAGPRRSMSSTAPVGYGSVTAPPRRRPRRPVLGAAPTRPACALLLRPPSPARLPAPPERTASTAPLPPAPPGRVPVPSLRRAVPRPAALRPVQPLLPDARRRRALHPLRPAA